MSVELRRTHTVLDIFRALVAEGLGAEGLRAGDICARLRDLDQPMGTWQIRSELSNLEADGSIVVDKVKATNGNFGFNAQREEYEDLVKGGVIDPTKVVRTALQNAASVASLLLTTEALVAEKPEKKRGSAGMPDMPDMDM